MLACKGPWAALWIEQSTIVGYYCAAAAGVITLALVREAMRGYQVGWKLAVASCFLVIHPAWTISARIGDCGAFRMETLVLVTCISIALMVFQYVAPKRPA
jgi:hypothetical protein